MRSYRNLLIVAFAVFFMLAVVAVAQTTSVTIPDALPGQPSPAEVTDAIDWNAKINAWSAAATMGLVALGTFILLALLWVGKIKEAVRNLAKATTDVATTTAGQPNPNLSAGTLGTLRNIEGGGTGSGGPSPDFR